jgi:glycosyltransferase involved in cell wall biosynthesis
MKIALVTDHAGHGRKNLADVATEPGSEAQRVTELAKTLAGLGHQVTIYAPSNAALPRKAAAPGVTIESVPTGPPAGPQDKQLTYLAAFSDQLARRWQRNTPDVVHAHFWTSGLAALTATRGLPVPVVQTFQTLGSTQQRLAWPQAEHAGRVKLETLIGRNVRTVLATSSAEVAELAGLGVPRSAIKVVPYGVDTQMYLPAGPVARRSKQPRLLTVAPLADQRQLDTIIRALALVPRAELLIAGGPPRAELAGDPAYRRLAGLAAELGVADRVQCTGAIAPARMPALLRSADLLVHIAPYEAFCMVPVEAMACGTPVVAAAEGSHSDAVVDGATGVLIPPDKPAVLARMIRRLLGSPMLLEGYGIAAADRARARYSWDRVGPEMVAAYEDAAGGAPAHTDACLLEDQVA